MAQSKKKRKKRKNRDRGPGEAMPAPSGGVMQGIVGGFRTVVGVGEKKEKKKASKIENIIWGIVLTGLLAYIAYTYTR